MNHQELNNTIQRLLKVKGIRNPELLEELSDHYLTKYESDQSQTDNHSQNLNSVKRSIDNLNLKQLDMNTQKQTISTYLQLGTAVLFSLSFVFFCTQSNKLTDVPPSMWPVQVGLQEIESGYGMRIHPIHDTQKMHKGIDIIGNIGELVYATSSGVISISIDKETGYGKHIIVDHDEVYQTKYCHLSELLVSTIELWTDRAWTLHRSQHL